MILHPVPLPLHQHLLPFVPCLPPPLPHSLFKQNFPYPAFHQDQLTEYQPYTRGLIPWVGFRQETLTYERDARFGGESKFSLLKSFNPFNEFIKGFTAFSEIPLYLSLVFGLLVAFGAFCWVLFILYHKFLGLTLPGWAAIMAVMLLLGGITLITSGVIGILDT